MSKQRQSTLTPGDYLLLAGVALNVILGLLFGMW
jgi:hypothetical protein